MKNRRTTIGLLAGAVLVLAVAAAAIGAAPSMRWHLLGSGGGPLAGTQNTLASAIGQPVTGKVSNGYTIYNGLVLQSLAPGPAKHYLRLPAIMHQACTGMASRVEIEPNGSPSSANGPLCPNVVYSGSPDSYGSGRDDDWFKFYWTGTGTIKVDLDNFLTVGQLLLYYNPNGPFLVQDYDQPDRQYTVSYTGTGQAGFYYIFVYAPAGHTTGGGDYTLTFQ